MAAAAVVAACAAEPVIERDDVARVLGALSADSMMGRRAFTPDADRAAALLAREFGAIGLDLVTGTDGYLQRFTVYSVVPERLRVVLNGRFMPEEQLAASLSTRIIGWETGDSVHLKVIGPADDPREALGAIRRTGGNTLVLMHPAHRATFERLRGSRPRTFELNRGPNTVYVLTDAAAARTFRVDARAEVEEQALANVVGMIPGRRSDEFVVFSAHYDHIGVQPPVDGDSIANGANDDASGVTAVVELARYFRAAGRPERTLLFVAFTAEEAGGYGSRFFSQQLDPGQIVTMFNIEMIGKVGSAGPNTAWITGFERSSFGAILQEAVAGTEYAFGPDPYPTQNLFYRSDNATLARLGVPAHSISTTPIDVDPDYHQVSDGIATLDLDHVTSTIRAIARAAATIVSGQATPTRVDPATVN